MRRPVGSAAGEAGNRDRGCHAGRTRRWPTSSTGPRLVYGHRTAVVDEPAVPGSLRDAHLPRARGVGVGHGPGPGRPRRGRTGAGGHRQPELRPLPDRVLRRQRLRPHPGADQLPADVRRDRLRRAAFRGVRPPVRPRTGRRGGLASRSPTGSAWTASTTPPSFVLASGERDAAGLGARRERRLFSQLHVGHDRSSQGRAAHAPQLLAQRDGVRLAHRCQRSRRPACTPCPCSTATAGACPMR